MEPGDSAIGAPARAERGDDGWVYRALPRLCAAWALLSPKEASPRARPQVSPDRDTGPVYALGERGEAVLRPSPPKAPEGLPPIRTASRQLPELPSLRAGELRFPSLAQAWMMGKETDPPPILQDPVPEPLPPFGVFELPDPPVKVFSRVSPHPHRGGYRWPMVLRTPLEKCRRQMLLRTDLSRVTYPRIPRPGELMAPMMEGEAAAARYIPPDRVGLEPEALRWDRIMGEMQGPVAPPNLVYLSPMAAGPKRTPPPVQGASSEGGEP